jgi:hypothetical protein
MSSKKSQDRVGSYLVFKDINWQSADKVTFEVTLEIQESRANKKLESLQGEYKKKFGFECPLRNPVVIEIFLLLDENFDLNYEIFYAFNKHNDHKPKLETALKNSLIPKLSKITYTYFREKRLDHSPLLNWLKKGTVKKHLSTYVHFINWYTGFRMYDENGKFINYDND